MQFSGVHLAVLGKSNLGSVAPGPGIATYHDGVRSGLYMAARILRLNMRRSVDSEAKGSKFSKKHPERHGAAEFSEFL